MAEKSGLFTYKTLVHALAGAAGSVIAMGTFFPLDTVRSRLQLDEHREAKHTLAVLQELVSEEGFGTLYRGMVPVLESLCASNFVYFYTFHGLKAVKGRPSEQSAARDLLLASVAGVVNVVTTNPLWVVNTRLKMKGVAPKNGATSPQDVAQYSGLLDGMLKIAHKEGVHRLWSGMMPSLILVSNPAIQFMIYEALKRHLHAAYGADSVSGLVYFAIGAVAKAVATVITYPLQLVQTKLRHGHHYKDLPPNAGLVQMTLYILKKYGVQGLYKGMEAKILQTILTAALMFAAYEKIASFVFKLLLSHQKMAVKMKH
ncbi:peroxisomal membrane protein PMP34 [Anabrus simplex]|uniref:peroxisomal membrane protein PMP34 n=1 Tax=Anabrus simplex TaxID=316456 RepID=UPI0035A3AF2E